MIGANLHATAEPPRRFVKPFCPKGHDKRVVGVSGCGHCRECRRSRPQRNDFHFVAAECVNGHDKRVVGVRSNGACAECHRIRNGNWWARTGGPAANPDHLDNGRRVPNLAAVRKDLGLTQKELALLSGVSLAVLQKVELGRNRARPPVLRALLGTVARLMRERRYEEMGL